MTHAAPPFVGMHTIEPPGTWSTHATGFTAAVQDRKITLDPNKALRTQLKEVKTNDLSGSKCTSKSTRILAICVQNGKFSVLNKFTRK